MEMLSKMLDRQSQSQEKLMAEMFSNFSQMYYQCMSAKESPRPTRPNNLPEYNGTPDEDLNSWLFLAEQDFRTQNTPLEKQTLVASSFLRGPALQWYRRIISERGEEAPLPFYEFKEGLKTIFLPHNYQQILRTKLDHLHQRSHLSHYVSTFMNIMNQIEDMSENDRIHYFIRGLATKSRAEVGYSCPKSLTHAIELAQNYDSNFFSSQKPYDTPSRIHWTNISRTCLPARSEPLGLPKAT